MIPGLHLADHSIAVPLDHGDPAGETITVFAREVSDPEGLDKPWLVYLQGGPGHESPRPTGNPRGPGWLDTALKEFRVLLLDQRGTGRSTPVTGLESAEYLTHFRADAIVRDCEALRTVLGSEPWTVLGQSYGGLCIFSYLSFAPDGLREALVTGGVPGIDVPIDDVYRATWERMVERNRRYYARYPQDRERMLALEDPERLRPLGHMLGMSDGYERLHYILESDPDSPAFREDTRDPLELIRNPIYGLLHEACWADGGVTNWSAARTRPEMPPEYLTGEHVLPWMLEGSAVAEELAQHDWPRLYDPDVLRANQVPVAATIYTEDLYVERRFAEETAATVPNVRGWVTSEYDHNGLRVDGERIFTRLLDLVRGRV